VTLGLQFLQGEFKECNIMFNKCDTVRYGAVRYGTVRYGTAPTGTVRYGAVLPVWYHLPWGSTPAWGYGPIYYDDSWTLR